MQAGRVLVAQRLIVGTAGNLSCKLDCERVLCMPSGVAKNNLTAEMFLTLARDGAIHASSRHAEGVRASSESAMHLAIYDAFDGVDDALQSCDAIVHAHPVRATALATVGQPLNLCVTAEGAATLGPVAIIDYVRPGTRALGALCARAVQQGARTLLLRQHGAVTIGTSIEDALWRMSALEHVASIWCEEHARGALDLLPDEEVMALRALAGTHTPGWGGAARWFRVEDASD